MSQSNIGSVYVLSNPAMPGIVKIGFTSRDVQKRVDELSSSTSVPKPFSLEYEVLIENPQKIETEIHNKLEKKRISKNREFFDITVEDAKRCINETVYGDACDLNAALEGIRELVRLAEKYPMRFDGLDHFDIKKMNVLLRNEYTSKGISRILLECKK